jgi:hypothetical protein
MSVITMPLASGAGFGEDAQLVSLQILQLTAAAGEEGRKAMGPGVVATLVSVAAWRQIVHGDIANLTR